MVGRMDIFRNCCACVLATTDDDSAAYAGTWSKVAEKWRPAGANSLRLWTASRSGQPWITSVTFDAATVANTQSADVAIRLIGGAADDANYAWFEWRVVSPGYVICRLGETVGGVERELARDPRDVANCFGSETVLWSFIVPNTRVLTLCFDGQTLSGWWTVAAGNIGRPKFVASRAWSVAAVNGGRGGVAI